MKRCFDIVFSFIGLLVFFPVIFLLALAIIVTTRESPFYSDYRMGRNGESFLILKLRTMCGKTPTPKGLSSRMQRKRERGRVTWIGNFLRKYGLDELPQLWNIFVGQMSFVGPRPLPLLLASRITYAPTIHGIRPGLTGLCQILPHCVHEQTRTRLDCLYAKKRTFCLDIYIMFRTIPALLKRKDF